jgi:dolichyl-diphosphooligosaccharide--protein glycosyltransferase
VRKFDVAALAAILLVAAGIRVWAPWDDVFSGTRVNFLETDAWYHVRLAEHQVRNFPHRLTTDPYAAPGGQYVAVAPLLDTTSATVAFGTAGRDASTDYIERIAALVPAIVGVLAVAAVWALATLAFDRRAGLIAGVLAAVLPGHFLDRSLVGFVDHHALEVLLSFATLVALVLAIRRGGNLRIAIGAGVCLGLYLLAWASGSYFVAILAVWVVAAAVVVSPSAEAAISASVTAIVAGTALVVVLLFQDPNLFRYNLQIAALTPLLLASIIVMFFAARITVAIASVAVASVMIVGLAWVLLPDLVQQVTIDIRRFRPDPTRMAVLEARPLFLYTGNWSWSQPWIFFRSGFYAGLVAVIGLSIAQWRSRRSDHLLIVLFTIANYLATVGQNRFGYYLVPATAVVCGWLATWILDRGGVPHAGNPAPTVPQILPFQRELAVIVVAGAIVAPNLVPAAITTTRVGGMPNAWFAAMQWLRANTPEPFGNPDYFYARYGRDNPLASFTIMNWWDQGYWVVQTARRVPVSNPTQGGAPASATFLTETDEAEAMEMLAAQRSRYVMVDWELPFRENDGGSLGGRFENLAGWASLSTSRFYSLCFSRSSEAEPWRATWVFREPYYQSMAYRLMVLGGAGATPVNNTYVAEIRDRRDASGRQFCEVVSRTHVERSEEAKRLAAQRGPGFEAVGFTAWQPAFDLAPTSGLQVVAEFRDPAQKDNETPMIRIFQVASSQ